MASGPRWSYLRPHYGYVWRRHPAIVGICAYLLHGVKCRDLNRTPRLVQRGRLLGALMPWFDI